MLVSPQPDHELDVGEFVDVVTVFSSDTSEMCHVVVV